MFKTLVINILIILFLLDNFYTNALMNQIMQIKNLIKGGKS
ncbi:MULTISPECIES: hypothetical protein [unclassified Clostridium]|nr:MULTISPECIES: hypothetical protein [unclassified Clostridium]